MKRARFHFTIQKLEEELFSTRAFHVSCIRNGKRSKEKAPIRPIVLVSHFTCMHLIVRPNFQNHKMLLQCYEHCYAHFLLAFAKSYLYLYSSVLNTSHVATFWNIFGRLTWVTLGQELLHEGYCDGMLPYLFALLSTGRR